jgi:cytochrome oxidase Cu insertion factor (SCO1/SenC/PrrC family)/ABC-type Zn2+ transport system substrate-binding protein/surface adhesin
MRSRMTKPFAVFSLMLQGLLLLWSGQTACAGDALRVVVSIKPIHSLVAGVTRGAMEPELLVQGEASPFDYALSEAQAEALPGSDLFIWVGPELEAFLTAPVKALPERVRVMELLSSDALKILPSRYDDGLRDPFFWLDDRNALILLDELTRLFVELDPARSHIYIRNRRDMLVRLAQLDREHEFGYRGLKAGLGLQYHDTLQYFEQAYALEILGSLSASPRQPVDVQRLLRMRGIIKDGEAVCLLTEAGMPAAHLSLLREGSAIRVAQLDSLGIGYEAGPELFFRLIQESTETIKRCLGADMEKAAAARTAAARAVPVQDGIGGRFILMDHLGRTITEQDMLGDYQLLYFGYTFCPDVCPTSMYVMTRALDLLGDKAKRIRPSFITVDPERDTVEVMRKYVEYFDPRFIGITGSKPMIERVAKQYGVKYEKVIEEGRDPELYLMDHSASVVLMGPDGGYITRFTHGITPEQMAQELAEIVR